MMTMSFSAMLLCFLGVGLWAIKQKKSDSEDYLLAGREVGPWAIGLSAMATGQSGFKFIGLIGYTYLTGVSGIWIIVGWFIGDYLAWNSIIPERLRIKSEEQGSLTLASYLSSHGKVKSSRLSILIGLIIFVFLSSYAAAQLSSASKSLQVLLDWNHQSGAYLSALIILLYCYAGGIRASIWTDVVQAIIMLVGMYGLVYLTLDKAGGLFHLQSNLEAIDPILTIFFPQSVGAFCFIFLSFIISGFGVLGQPHIMVRSMALKSAHDMPLVKNIYLYLGYSMSLGGYLVGLGARVLYPQTGLMEAEMIMPRLAEQLFHPILSGFLLASLFASTVSTADSQILVCASSLVGDVFTRLKRSYIFLKISTVVTVCFTLFISLNSSHVFTLILFSWSVLASSLTALLVIKTVDQRPPVGVCIFMIVGGGTIAILWRVLGLQSLCFESLPGIASSLIPFLAWKLGVYLMSSQNSSPALEKSP